MRTFNWFKAALISIISCRKFRSPGRFIFAYILQTNLRIQSAAAISPILKTAGFSTQQFSLMAAIFPFGGVIGAVIMGWYMDKLNPTNVIRYAYLFAFILFIITGFVSSNFILFSISLFLIGALLVGAQSSLLPLSALFYPSTCRAVGVSWMHGIGRVGAIIGAFYGSLIFTFELSLSGIFYILAIPTVISFIALSIKVISEKSKDKQEINTQELA